MDDEADLKKMIEVLRSSKEEHTDTDDFQYQEFINFEDSEGEEEDDQSTTTQDYDFEKTFTLDISTLYKYNPTSTLKTDEKALIDSCTETDLKKLLMLNRQKNMQLIQMYKKFKDLLIECKQNILEKNEIVKQYYAAFKTQRQSSGSWRVCAPYFKDKGFYVSPPNSDTIKKKNNKELSCYDLMPLKKWTQYECNRLIGAVKLNYNANVVMELKKTVRLANIDEMTEEQKKELNEMKLRLNKLSNAKNFEIPPLGSNENINWIRVADIFIRDKHSEFECRAFWHIFLHPSITKGAWKQEESKKLLELAKKYKNQHWDLIAKELDTNRTCFSVATHFFSNLYSSLRKGEFTYEEDRKLLELIRKYRVGDHIPWVTIVRHFKNRTRCQLHHRFTYYLSQVDKRKGKFSEAEDVMILITTDKFGLNYRKCSEYLPERSVNQIKGRYSSNLKGDWNKFLWRVEDDKVIMEHAKKYEKRGNSWEAITSVLKRSRGQIRQRYIVVKNFLDKNPGCTVEDVPRRKHLHRWDHNYITVRKVADHFLSKNLEQFPSMEEIEEVLEMYHYNPASIVPKFEFDETRDNKNVDELLTDFFCNSDMQSGVVLNSHNLKRAVDEVETLLDVLNVNLVIPETFTESSLDYIDVTILEELRKRKYSLGPPDKEVKMLMPPSFHTTTAMRSLLVNYLHFKNEKIAKKSVLPFKSERIFGNFDIYQSAKSKAKKSIMQELMDLSESDLALIQTERDRFYRRFQSLFMWPAVLTVQPPNPEFVNIVENLNAEPVRPAVKRTYSKKKNSDIEQANKVRILDANATQTLQLTPVTDKSVIVNLLKDNSKKLFSLDKVQCGKETKTFIKEVDLEFLGRQEADKGTTIFKPKAVEKIRTYWRKAAKANRENAGTSRYGADNDVMEITKSADDNDGMKINKSGNHNVMEIMKSGNDNDVMEITKSDIDINVNEIDADDDLMDLDKLTNFIKMEKSGN